MKNSKILILLLVIVLIVSLFVGCSILKPTTPEITLSGDEKIVKSSGGTSQEKIIFSSNQQDDNYEIYMMDPDGSNQERLTTNSAEDLVLDLSPNGTKILFFSNRDSNTEIYIMNIDGSNQENLTNNSSEEGGATFSPDGNEIVFFSDRNGYFNVYVMDVDGSNQTMITDLVGVCAHPIFTPDGSQIIFSFRTSFTNCDYNDFYTVDADGSNMEVFYNKWGSDAYPRFSPDGNEIVFNHTVSSKAQIYIIDADGTNEEVLTTGTIGNNMHPCFSPNGDKIIFSSSLDGDYEIYIMDADGSNWIRRTDNSWHDQRPIWGYVVLPSIEVPLDIKPGSCPNPINVKSQGVLPVAVLGTADFDVNQIDPASITLEGVSPLRWDLEDVSTPFEPYIGKTDCEQDCNILGPDGIIDLTFKFDTQEVLDLLGDIESYDIEQEDLEAFESGESDQLITTTEDALLDGACLTVTLTGTLTDGTNILGEDLVLILRKGK